MVISIFMFVTRYDGSYKNNFDVTFLVDSRINSLDLSFINDTSDNIINMGFLNNLTKLENLIIYGDSQRIDMTGVENLTLKQFTFYADSYSKEFENQLTYAFPNAEVSIVSDYYDLYSQSIR